METDIGFYLLETLLGLLVYLGTIERIAIAGLVLCGLFSIVGWYSVGQIISQTAASDEQNTKTVPPLWTKLSRCTPICTLIVVIATIGNLVLVSEKKEPATTKSSDLGKFRSRLETGGKHLAGNEQERAKESYWDALSLSGIPLADASKPMVNLAEIMIHERKFERAYPLALIAAVIHPGKPEFVNPLAEVLIELCEIDKAADKLGGLGIDKDERSHELIERAESNHLSCLKD